MKNALMFRVGICFFILLQCAGAGFASEKPARIGYAYDKDTMQLLYIEEHYQITNDGRPLHSRVIYTDKEGNTIADKTNDYTRDIFMPDFYLENYLTGHIESASLMEDEFLVTFRRQGNGKVKEKTIERSSNGIVDAGFDNSIKSAWDSLIQGEVIEKDFLIPSLARYIRFRIYQSRLTETAGEKYRIIHIEPANLIARAIAGTTYLSYDYTVPVLREYIGTSNMRDGSGKNLNVVIKYSGR